MTESDDHDDEKRDARRKATDEQIARLLRLQDGVVARRQVVAAGADDTLIERRVRRREWARVHRGVLVDHTGPLSWGQRAWAAVLVHPVAALDASSALRAAGVRTTGAAPDAVELVVPLARRVVDPRGVRSRRLGDFESSCQLHLSPPRVRLELAALRVAANAGSEDAAVAVLGDFVQTGRTTPDRMRRALADVPRTRRRALLLEVLDDVGVGALSALERRYLRDVERAHGLPAARRQVRAVGPAGAVYRDAVHDEQHVVVELEGRLGHSTAAERWADLERDLTASVAGLVTLRAGWQQALEPCRLAHSVWGVLRSRGWDEPFRPCARCPPDRPSATMLVEDSRHPLPEVLH